MQHSERMPSKETRGAGPRRSDDADRDVRGGAPSRAAGERSRECGVGIPVNVREGTIL